MIQVVLIVLILLMLWPLLAEVRMVIHAILHSASGAKDAPSLQAQSPLRRWLLLGMTGHLQRWQKEYGQYTRLQLWLIAAAAGCCTAVLLLVALRWIVPALIVTFGFDIAAFAGISILHAHAGYDPDTRTTRYDRHS